MRTVWRTDREGQDLTKTEPSRRLAVLIDAENTQPRVADLVFAEIARFGQPLLRQAYGDFNTGQAKAWVSMLPRLAILPVQQFAAASGKNAADIALVIDAMDLLHGDRFDGFCIVSSDSDFTRLAIRIRQEGKLVIGFGRASAHEGFRKACDHFIIAEPVPPAATKVEPPKLANPVKAVAKPVVTPVVKNAAKPAAPAADVPKKPVKQAIKLIREAMTHVPQANGWATLSAIGTKLRKDDPGFDPRHYGHRTLLLLVKGSNGFDVEDPVRQHVRIRDRARIAVVPPSLAGAT